MRGGEHEAARAYVLYREKRSQERAAKNDPTREAARDHDPRRRERARRNARPRTADRCSSRRRAKASPTPTPTASLKATLKDLYDGVPIEEVRKWVVLSARTLIEKDPDYSYVTARLLLDALRFEALGEEATQAEMETKYAEYFPRSSSTASRSAS